MNGTVGPAAGAGGGGGWRHGVELAGLTTLRLGGPAGHYFEADSEQTLIAAIKDVEGHGEPLLILGGGSNLVVADEGYPGSVVKVGMLGVTARDGLLSAAAGEVWDDVVARSVAEGLAGIECLSGIPGLAGATPIQNVGAYGQEIADTLVSVRCLERDNLGEVVFTRDQCEFVYRGSRFKGRDRDRYVVLDVSLRLRRDILPQIRYAELAQAIGRHGALERLEPGQAARVVRDTVVELRRRKSMVLDPTDPNARSVGSFFVNPVLSTAAFDELARRRHAAGEVDGIPTFPADGRVKVAAAWLIEHAGFAKGYRYGGVGISTRHALALVNHGGTTTELLALAQSIERAVYERFGVRLEREPVVVG